MKTLKKILLGISILLISPTMLFAHGSDEVGRVEMGEYIITVDSIVETLTSGSAQRLNVEMEKKTSTSTEEKQVNYTDVWIRITGPNDEFLFSGNIHRTAVGFVTGFSYFFAEPGTHELAMRFLNDGNIVAEGSIPIPIKPGVATEKVSETQHPDSFFVIVAGIVGLLVGTGIMWRAGRRRIK